MSPNSLYDGFEHTPNHIHHDYFGIMGDNRFQFASSVGIEMGYLIRRKCGMLLFTHSVPIEYCKHQSKIRGIQPWFGYHVTLNSGAVKKKTLTSVGWRSLFLPRGVVGSGQVTYHKEKPRKKQHLDYCRVNMFLFF